MSSKLNERLQVAGNLAIIAGLLLVGVQLSQNSDLLKTQLLYEESQRISDLESQYVGENAAAIWAKSIEDPESLTLAEQRVMESLLWNSVEEWRGLQLLAELGLLEDSEWRTRVENETPFVLGNRYAAAWWLSFNFGGSSIPGDLPPVPDDLTRVINDTLAKSDPDYTPRYFRRTMEILNEKKNESESEIGVRAGL